MLLLDLASYNKDKRVSQHFEYLLQCICEGKLATKVQLEVRPPPHPRWPPGV